MINASSLSVGLFVVCCFWVPNEVHIFLVMHLVFWVELLMRFVYNIYTNILRISNDLGIRACEQVATVLVPFDILARKAR